MSSAGKASWHRKERRRNGASEDPERITLHSETVPNGSARGSGDGDGGGGGDGGDGGSPGLPFHFRGRKSVRLLTTVLRRKRDYRSPATSPPPRPPPTPTRPSTDVDLSHPAAADRKSCCFPPSLRRQCNRCLDGSDDEDDEDDQPPPPVPSPFPSESTAATAAAAAAAGAGTATSATTLASLSSVRHLAPPSCATTPVHAGSRATSQHFRKRREKSVFILVSIVLIFIVCHTFRQGGDDP